MSDHQFPAADDIENWSLEAIVRGSSGNFTEIGDIDMEGQDSLLDGTLGNHHEFFATFPEIFEINDFSDELEELYKPFYPAKSSSVIEFEDQKLRQPAGCVARPNPAAANYKPKYKKRKNQHKRVVMQVSGEGLGSDMWAWRKYGQKPIKGSPYPRSYYRCSSSKVCLARKQVEESCTDPGMYIITYTEEHNHSQPTRRNSLAGTVRQKFPSPNNNKIIKQEKPNESSITSTSSGSPQNILQESEFTHQAIIKQEMKKFKEEHHHDDFGMSDFIFKDDFFSGLEDFDDFVSEMYTSNNNSAHQFHVRSCS
ncbi:hypothetical protein RD792_001478 [Penstemon davidsonii]|uniref:WRKY domain-containing protein n=1 Tax=Penstemon davidsonii TaxID=160366 RepID=A0ABR0DNI1_9LAMI|nr:hypothetical protein RD792_001478 [Penstemon davidsonii]